MGTKFEPYVGPRPYEQKDQELFFGREREVKELRSLTIAHPMLLFYSQSGAGKTSLINARLVSLLKDEGYEVLPTARVQGIENEKASNIYVFNTLISWAGGQTDPQQLAELSLAGFLKKRQHFKNKEGWELPRFAIFDQFEELFTFYAHRWDDRQGFFEQIRDALEEDSLLRVIFAMREDYIAELDPYASLLPERLRTRFRLERLRAKTALLAVTKPLAKTDRRFAEGVAEQLIVNLLQIPPANPDGEPVVGQVVEPVQLQVVCRSLWQALQPEDRVITREHLESCGDVNRALSEFYENSIKSVARETGLEEGVLRRWFGNALITPDGTRGTVFRGHERTGEIPNTAVALIEKLHLIKGEWRGGGRWYELTHDRLIEPILKSNDKWLAERSGAEQTRRDLEVKAAEWVRMGRGSSGLLDEGELLVAKRWLESPEAVDVGYSEALFALVAASRAAIGEAARQRGQALAAEQQRRLRQVRSGLIIMFALLVAMAGMTVFAFQQKAEAETQRNGAQQARNEAESARAEAERQENEAIRQAQAAKDERAIAQEQTDIAKEQKGIAEQQRRLADQQRHIAETRLNEVEDLRKIALARQLAAQSELIRTQRPDQPGLSVLLATEAMNRSNTFLEADQALRQGLALLPKRPLSPVKSPSLSHGGSIVGIAFSTTGRYLATASSDNTAQVWEVSQLWNAMSPSQKVATVKHEDDVNAVAFSPTGRYLATASSDNTARLSELAKGNSVAEMKHDAKVVALAFSPDGLYLATASSDKTARVWEVPSGKQIAVMRHGGEVTAITFSLPDGQYLATVSSDNTARVWGARNGIPITQPMRHEGLINSVAFSPNGRYLATASSDKTARVWDARDGFRLALLPHDDNVIAVAFSRDGRYVATGSYDHTTRLWNTTTGLPVTDPMRHEGRVYAIAFSQDGGYLATVSSDKTARLWDVNTGKQVTSLEHGSEVVALAFRPPEKDEPNWRNLVTVTSDNKAQIWQVASAPEGQQIEFGSRIEDVSFSPEGKFLATISSRNTAQLWEAITGNRVSPPIVQADGIDRISLSRDGEYLATSSSDKIVRVWKAKDGREIRQREFDGDIAAIALSPDGAYLAIVSSTPTSRTPDFNAAISPIPTSNIWIVQAPTLQQIIEPIKLEGRVHALAFSQDGKYLATAGSNNTAQVWEALTGRPTTPPLLHEGSVYSVAFSPDGRYLATASEDNSSRLWDAHTGDQLKQIIHDYPVGIVAFRSDNGARDRYLSTITSDFSAHLWELHTDGKTDREVARINLGYVRSAAFSLDGRYLATANRDVVRNDWTARIWLWRPDLLTQEACARLATNMTWDDWQKYVGDVTYRKTCGDLPIPTSSFIQTGKKLAREGDDKGALAIFTEAKKLDPELKIDPYAEVRQIRADIKVQAGRRRAEAGDVNAAIKLFAEARELKPDLKLDPEREAQSIASAVKVKAGRNRAATGDFKGAVAAFKEALSIDPNLKLDPETEAHRWSAPAKVEQARALARSGDIEGSIARFNEALQIDPSLSIDPKAEAYRIAATAKLDRGRLLARQGKISETIAAYAEARKLSPNMPISASYWNSLCWFGSLFANAADVMDACERAVELDPANGDFRDSRGVARALTGNTEGAIEDFKAYINWTVDPERKAQRQGWIDALKAGRIPAEIFTEQEKKRLLSQ